MWQRNRYVYENLETPKKGPWNRIRVVIRCTKGIPWGRRGYGKWVIATLPCYRLFSFLVQSSLEGHYISRMVRLRERGCFSLSEEEGLILASAELRYFLLNAKASLGSRRRDSFHVSCRFYHAQHRESVHGLDECCHPCQASETVSTGLLLPESYLGIYHINYHDNNNSMPFIWTCSWVGASNRPLTSCERQYGIKRLCHPRS